MTPEDVGKWIGGAVFGCWGVFKSIGFLVRKRRPLSIADRRRPEPENGEERIDDIDLASETPFSDAWIRRVEGRLRDYHRFGQELQVLVGRQDTMQREHDTLRKVVEAQALLYADRTRAVERIEARLDDAERARERLAETLAEKLAQKIDGINDRIDRLVERRLEPR